MGMKEFEPIFANDGYRPNVGIVICNKNGMVFWARRIKRDGWQFPQGGVAKNETLQEAMYRELREETGLAHHQVRIISHTAKWIRYELPKSLRRRRTYLPNIHQRGTPILFRGQKQVWFLLELVGDDSDFDLCAGDEQPEFDAWRWVDPDFVLENIVDFKRGVYRQIITQFKRVLNTDS